VVILDQSTLAFEDHNIDLGLLVCVSSEGLGLLAGDHSAAGDNLGHNATYCFYAKSEGSYVDEKKVFSLL